MAERKDWIDSKELEKLNDGIYEKSHVDREDILTFLTLVNTTDSTTIVAEIRKWLSDIHDDPKFDKIVFPQGDIDAVIGDLDSYGRIQQDTILEFKESSNKNMVKS